MRKAMLIIGIILIVCAALGLLYGLLNWFMFYNVLDGSHELYERLKRMAVLFTSIGGVGVVAGIALLIIRKFIK